MQQWKREIHKCFLPDISHQSDIFNYALHIYTHVRRYIIYIGIHTSWRVDKRVLPCLFLPHVVYSTHSNIRIQYTFHLIRTGEQTSFRLRGFELKPIDRRQDTNLGASPIICETRHLSQHKPRDRSRIPAAFTVARFLCAGETSKSDYLENFEVSPWPSEYLGDASYPINRNVITPVCFEVQCEIWVAILL